MHTSKASPDAFSFLSGQGEMVSRTRLHNWAATSIGPPDMWPQSLKTTLSILLQSKFPMFLWWGKDLVQFYNDAYRPSLGKEGKHPAALGQKGEDCWPEIWPVIKPLIDQVLQTGEPTWSENQLIPIYRNGGMEDVYWTFSYSPVNDEEGKIGGVLVICNETTEQVKAKIKLEESEQKAGLAIASADLGTYEINLETDEMQTSARFNIIWGGIPSGLSRNDIINVIHPDDREIRIKAHHDSLITGNLHYEVRVVWANGIQHWVRVKGKVLYNNTGKAITLLGVVQDITEQKQISYRLTELVNERTRELQRSNDDLLQFAHVTSHDLKEPVRKVSIFSKRLQQEFGDVITPKGVEYINKIQHSTRRMFSMIEGVLSYSSINSVEQKIERIDLNILIANILADLEIPAQQKKAVIQFYDLPEIEGSTVLIYQLLYNLLNNALKFTKPDAPPVISIAAKRYVKDGREMLKLDITDNGIGFEQDYAEKIFESFARLNTKDEFEGTGLGLALCKKIAERHSGSISAAGVKGKGAVFSIFLPYNQEKNTI